MSLRPEPADGGYDGGVLPLLARRLPLRGPRAGLRHQVHEHALQPAHRLAPHESREHRQVYQVLPERY